MNYEQKYKEALERARVYHMGGSISAHIAEVIFPELAESEDDKIRKAIISILKGEIRYISIEDTNKYVAWLEKLGKQKSVWSEEIPNCHKTQGKSALEAIKEEKVDNQNCVKSADKVEPKFKVGDWVVRGKSIVQISDIQGQYYIGIDIYGNDLTLRSDKIRLWTINDAKDGDVLVTGVDKNPFIFKGLLDSNHPNCPVAYCGIDPEGYFCVSLEKYWWTDDKDDVQPATKEQRDLLFQKMKEAGYEWDAEKKELPKIVDKSSWSEQDERNLKGVIDEIEANKNSAPDCDLATHDRFLSCLKSIRQRIGV